MRHEPSFLKDILPLASDLFLKDEVLPAAVLHHLTVIGEAISRLSVELRERHPEMPWRQVIAVRHRIVHAYFDLEIRRQVLHILTTEFPGSEPGAD